MVKQKQRLLARRCQRCGIRMRAGARRKRCPTIGDLVCGDCLTKHGNRVECEGNVQHTTNIVLEPDESAIVLRNDHQTKIYTSVENNKAGRDSASYVSFINRLLGHHELCQLVERLMNMGVVGGSLIEIDPSQLARQMGSIKVEIDPKDLN